MIIPNKNTINFKEILKKEYFLGHYFQLYTHDMYEYECITLEDDGFREFTNNLYKKYVKAVLRRNYYFLNEEIYDIIDDWYGPDIIEVDIM